ncbi:MAG: Lcl C-terminal domain-containing protein [Wenzhouxiangella sp.]
MSISRTVVFFAIIGLGLSSSAWANDRHCQANIGENRATTPDADFQRGNDGTVIHNRSGLQWGQCALGQQANGRFCEGRATAMSWQEATAAVAELNANGGKAGFSDWRLPSREELETIVERCREAPAVNENIFPNTPWAGFWTNSLEEVDGEVQSWFVGFYRGLSYPFAQSASYRVRVVRDR